MMAGFCGGCGSPRPDGAKFCMNCGQPFAAPEALCPTCGQLLDEPVLPPTPPTLQSPQSPPPGSPSDEVVESRDVEPRDIEPIESGPAESSTDADEPHLPRGPHACSFGTVFFDGQGWYEARRLPGGVWIPDVARPLPDLDPAVTPVTPLGASEIPPAAGEQGSSDYSPTTRG